MKTKDLIPDRGLFPIYLRYARTQTDAPDLFHIGSLLAIMSAAATKQSVVSDGKEHQLQLQVLLAAPSGDRKSTSMQLALHTFQGATRLLELERSPERTFAVWSKQPTGMLCYPEGSAFFDMLRKPAWGGGVGLLPSALDGMTMHRFLPGKRRRVGGETYHEAPVKITVQEPKIAFLGGISPALLWRKKCNATLDVTLRHLMVLYAERERFQAIQGFRDCVLEARMRRRLFEPALAELTTVRFGAAASRSLQRWSDALPGCNMSVVRLPLMVLKVAALYVLSGEPDKNVAMKKALALGDVALESISKLWNLR